MKHILAFLCSLAVVTLAAFTPAFAGPIPYNNSVFDTPNQVVNSVIANLNATQAPFATLVTASGTTTATATGQRANVSVTGLSTAASGTSATMTVTDTAVTASSQVFCQPNGYAGTGIPVIVNVVPGAGTFTFAVQNVSTSAALNATVTAACIVFN